MAILPVLAYPDKRLKIISTPIATVTDETRRLMDDMVDTMMANDGCGLAAPQVDVHHRIIVIDLSYRDPDFKTLFMTNPEILWKSEELMTLNDGCLSVPSDRRGAVARANKIRVRYLDRDNVFQEYEVSELLAYAVQHEIDHLNGILYIDHLSPLKRQLVVNKIKKKR